MTNIEFSPVILNKDPTSDRNVIALIEDALGRERSLDEFKNRIDHSSGNTIILGGYIGDEIVCMNVFMRMRFKYKDREIHGYQSGFSAASSKYRGKGLWPKLMSFSEGYLSQNNASFIYGFPNKVSHPVFMKKLGYESFNMHRVRISPTTLWSKRPFNTLSYGQSHTQRQSIMPILEDNISWKTREYGPDAFSTYHYKSSLAWGRRKATKKLGFKLSYFEIGGFDLHSPQELQGLVNTIFRGESVLFCTVSLNEGHEYFSLFQSAGLEDEPLIIKMLGNLTTDDMALNFFSGMRDTF